MAQEIVKTRRHMEKMHQFKMRLQAVSRQLQTVQSQVIMTQSMTNVTRAMARMNNQINLPSLQRTMMEFQRQSQMMDLKDEMINDTSKYLMLLSVLFTNTYIVEEMWSSGEEDDVEEEDIVNQVLDEIGINLKTEVYFSFILPSRHYFYSR